MKDVVPAFLFIGSRVRVSTKIEKSGPPEVLAMDEEDGPLTEEASVMALQLLGTVLDSDAAYLTLGVIDENGDPHPKIALKHEDIMLIEADEEDLSIQEFMPSFDDDSMLN
jgi:hypothetical protein